jgi:hypothetical protein
MSGCGSSVEAKIHGNEKENFTADVSGSAAVEKFPLEFIATGKRFALRRLKLDHSGIMNLPN